MARQTSVTVNLPPDIKRLVEKRAAADGRSESNYVKRLIEADLGLLSFTDQALTAADVIAEAAGQPSHKPVQVPSKNKPGGAPTQRR